MSNQFSVPYNGHPVAVTVLNDNSYLVQVSYQPLHISKISAPGGEKWVEVHTRQETFVTREIGKLIESHSALADA